jgi:2-C-methyl-D-erythritol 4-phosphate cytidylyltransferase
MAGLVLAAAGRGSRFAKGADAENKIWTLVGGRPLLEWSLAAFDGHEEIETIILVGAEG